MRDFQFRLPDAHRRHHSARDRLRGFPPGRAVLARRKAPSFLEELLFIGGLVFGVSLLVAGVFRLRLIRRVNQVSSRALEILHADNRTARLEEGSAGTDLAELSGAGTGSSTPLTRLSRNFATASGGWPFSQALTELTSRQTGVTVTVSDRLRTILETCSRTRAPREHMAIRG